VWKYGFLVRYPHAGVGFLLRFGSLLVFGSVLFALVSWLFSVFFGIVIAPLDCVKVLQQYGPFGTSFHQDGRNFNCVN
jgi:hypothetical protein